MQKIYICPECNKCGTYPERFVQSILIQLNVLYVKEEIFLWSNNKKYDFYLPEHNCIIETHGKQHYEDCTSFKGGRSYFEERLNDEFKEMAAREFGKIENYIVIDCRKSSKDWIKQSVCNSDLFNIIFASPKEVDWNECHSYAVSNITKEICDDYNAGFRIQELCEMYDLSWNTIKQCLKNGAEIGWCDYSFEKAMKERNDKIVESMLKRTSKPVIQYDINMNQLSIYPSIQEAQRSLNISHIWDCISGRRNSAGGYIWKYKDET